MNINATQRHASMLFVTQTKNKFVMLKVLKELSGKGAVLDLHSDSVQRKLNRLHVRRQCSLQTTHMFGCTVHAALSVYQLQV